MLIPALLTGNVNADVGQVFGYALLWGLSAPGPARCSPPRPGRPPTASPRAGAASPRRPHRAQAARARPARHHRARYGDLDRRRRHRRQQPRQPLAADRARRQRAVRGRPRGATRSSSDARRLRAPRAPARGARPPPPRRPAAEDRRRSSDPFRLFAYRDGTSAIVFLLMLVVLIGTPLVAALYAGFVVARERAAGSPLSAPPGARWSVRCGRSRLRSSTRCCRTRCSATPRERACSASCWCLAR